MALRKRKAAADHEEIATTLIGYDAAIARTGKDCRGVNRFRLHIAGKSEGSTARQEKTIPFAEAHNINNAFHGEQAFARNDSSRFDAFLLILKLNRPFAACRKPGRHVIAWFQKR